MPSVLLSADTTERPEQPTRQKAGPRKGHRPPPLRLSAITLTSLAIIASFWLPWFRIFNEPMSGLDVFRMFSYFSQAGKALRISPWVSLIPCSMLVLGLISASWTYMLLTRPDSRAHSALKGIAALLSASFLAFASWLAWSRHFWQSFGLGLWLAYCASAVLICLTIPSLFALVSSGLRPLLDFMAYAIVRLFAWGLSVLPRAAAVRWGETLAAIAFRLMPRRRMIALRNLELVFGNSLSGEEKAQIAELSFICLGRLAAEFARLPKLLPLPAESLFTYENLSAVERARSRGKGLIILTGHFGCWELSPLAMTKAGFPMTALARPLDNPFLDRWINRRREMAGTKVIARASSVRKLVSALKAGETVAILFDQNVHRKECVFAELAGRYTASSPLPAALARMTGADVIFGAGVACADGRHKLILSDPIPMQQKEDYEEFVTTNTSAYNRVFEQFIRKYPEAWLWVHNRFKDTQDSPGFWKKRRTKRLGN